MRCKHTVKPRVPIEQRWHPCTESLQAFHSSDGAEASGTTDFFRDSSELSSGFVIDCAIDGCLRFFNPI